MKNMLKKILLSSLLVGVSASSLSADYLLTTSAINRFKIINTKECTAYNNINNNIITIPLYERGYVKEDPSDDPEDVVSVICLPSGNVGNSYDDSALQVENDLLKDRLDKLESIVYSCTQ